MALTTQQKQDCVAEILAGDPEPYNLSRSDTSAALDAADTWAQNNQVAFNNALPAAAKATLTTTQKNLLLASVCKRRAGF